MYVLSKFTLSLLALLSHQLLGKQRSVDFRLAPAIMMVQFRFSKAIASDSDKSLKSMTSCENMSAEIDKEHPLYVLLLWHEIYEKKC